MVESVGDVKEGRGARRAQEIGDRRSEIEGRGARREKKWKAERTEKEEAARASRMVGGTPMGLER